MGRNEVVDLQIPEAGRKDWREARKMDAKRDEVVAVRDGERILCADCWDGEWPQESKDLIFDNNIEADPDDALYCDECGQLI